MILGGIMLAVLVYLVWLLWHQPPPNHPLVVSS